MIAKYVGQWIVFFLFAVYALLLVVFDNKASVTTAITHY